MQGVKYFRVIHYVGRGTVGCKFRCHEVHHRCHVAEIASVTLTQIVMALAVGGADKTVLGAFSVTSLFVWAAFAFHRQIKLLAFSEPPLVIAVHQLYDGVLMDVAKFEFRKSEMIT